MGALGRQRGKVRPCRDEQEDNHGLAGPREGSVLLPPRGRVTGLRLKPQENPALARVLPEPGERRNSACFSLPPHLPVLHHCLSWPKLARNSLGNAAQRGHPTGQSGTEQDRGGVRAQDPRTQVRGLSGKACVDIQNTVPWH